MKYILRDVSGEEVASVRSYPEAVIAAVALSEAGGPISLNGEAPKSFFEWSESLDKLRALFAPA